MIIYAEKYRLSSPWMFYFSYNRPDLLDCLADHRTTCVEGCFNREHRFSICPGRDVEPAFFQREKGSKFVRKKSSF